MLKLYIVSPSATAMLKE
uniref:Uncharacterized protein n=1 Tax=Anguilla anguilla TaxID=7936 RepID=A0A0E9TUY7_ANGAN